MHNEPSSAPSGSNSENPYQSRPIQNQQRDETVASPDATAQQWPIKYTASMSEFSGVVLPIILGIMLLGFGFLMFLAHLFLLDTNQMSLHLSSTLPVIMGVFSLMRAWSNNKSVREVRMWPQGIELIRTSKQTIPWDQIKDVRVADSCNPGTVGQKVITLAGADNEPIGTISGSFNQHEAMVRQIRELAAVAEPAPNASRVASAAGKRKGRRTALVTGFGALLLGAAGVTLPLQAYWQYEAEKLIASAGVDGNGTVTERFVAPNGRTHRVKYDVTGSNGATESHNVEVTREFYGSVTEGDAVPIRYVPDRPDISELAAGQVQSDDMMDSPLALLIMGIFGILATMFMVPITILSWKGYDVNFNQGKLRIVPLE